MPPAFAGQCDSKARIFLYLYRKGSCTQCSALQKSLLTVITKPVTWPMSRSMGGRSIWAATAQRKARKSTPRLLIAERFSTGKSNGTPQPVAAASGMTINELILQYWQKFVEITYVKDGEPSERQYHIRQARRPLKELLGRTLANEFGPRSLKTVRDKMIDDGVESRGGLNRKISSTTHLLSKTRCRTGSSLLPLSFHTTCTWPIRDTHSGPRSLHTSLLLLKEERIQTNE